MRHSDLSATHCLIIISALLVLALPAAGDTPHTVRPGDSVWSIAEQHSVSYSAVLRANSLHQHSTIHPGRKLVIPGISPVTSHTMFQRIEAVRDGESLWSLSRASQASLYNLAAANGLRPDTILHVARKLTAPGTNAAGQPAPEDVPTTRYIVKKGDCLWDIARRHGTTVRALARLNGRHPDGVLHVGAALLIPTPSQTASFSADDSEHRFVEAALEYRGVRYRYGGMSTRGMDCSGLVALVLRNSGIDAPHNSKALYRLGKQVPRDQLQPGDLVFFHTTRPGISHVGIYIGDQKFIHASSGKGRVRVDRLDKGYYSRRLVGAKRVS